jgi:FkbM family methyltransferase
MQAIAQMQKAKTHIYGVLHVGANEGQEGNDYFLAGANPCIYVEPIDAVFSHLSANIKGFPGHVAVQAVCSDKAGEKITFNIASNGGLSSSILPLGAHAEFHPSIVYSASKEMITTTVDDLLDSLSLPVQPNLLVIDTQGADLKVLQGADRSLSGFDGIFVEVSDKPLYQGGCTHFEITSFLGQKGFRLTWMELDSNGHGDAFYSRIPDVAVLQIPRAMGKNIALGKRCSQSSRATEYQHRDSDEAVNAEKNGNFSFHTQKEQNPWWQVDLGEIETVQEVRVFNRLDAARDRARTLQVLASTDAERWFMIHDHGGYTFGGIDGRPLIVRCNERARYIRLKCSDYTFLHLDGVEVYASSSS